MPRTRPGQIRAALLNLVASHEGDEELRRSVTHVLTYLKPGKSGAPVRWDVVALVHLRYVVAFHQQNGIKLSSIYADYLGPNSQSSMALLNKRSPDKGVDSGQIRNLDAKARRLIASDSDAARVWAVFEARLTARSERKAAGGLSSGARVPMSLPQARKLISSLFNCP
ncbi:hypothetical protein FNL55_20915 [Tardiphaga sp. vice352]|uniref:hypothetical protein n=1 Tax=Tardiphaga sp. vice352 TaxID=2592816 RepID=UPI001161F4A3|nr:hypothetical protein [Tardiphaga sp. vice352]QDM33524.1 hypothetical protein FNL55_20915 [Tardiphaga sp. vice352]